MSLFINSKNLFRSSLILFLPFFALSLFGFLVTSQPQAGAQSYSEKDCSLKIREAACEKEVKEKCPGPNTEAKDRCIATVSKPYDPVYKVCRDKDDPQECHKTVKEACKNRTTTSSRERCKSETANSLDDEKASAQANEKFGFGDKPETNGQCGTGDSAVKTRLDFGCVGAEYEAEDKKIGPIEDLAYAIIRFLSVGVGLVMVASIIYAGIQYSSSEGSPEATVAAKKRIQNAIIGLVFYLFIFAFVQYLVPGGLFVP